MSENLPLTNNRITFAEKRMKTKKDFKAITNSIKEECLSYGYGNIKLDKDIEDLWIDDYENDLA